MVISHKYKFIFVKTQKTAGTSIEVFLSQLCADDDVLTPISPHVEPHVARNHEGIWNPLPELLDRGINSRSTIKDLLRRNKFYNHIPAREVRHRVSSNIWNEYFKFCVERNPWDKSISHYHRVNDRAGGGITFEQYISSGQFCLNYPKYTDSHGKLLVDRVIRYESLMDGLAQVFGELGVPFEGSLGVKAKSEHRKDRRHYREIYTNEQRRVIEAAFANEIEMHGYSF